MSPAPRPQKLPASQSLSSYLLSVGKAPPRATHVPAVPSLPCGLQGTHSGHLGTFGRGSVSLGHYGHSAVSSWLGLHMVWTPGRLVGAIAAPVPVPCLRHPPPTSTRDTSEGQGGWHTPCPPGLGCGQPLPSLQL